MKQKNQVLKLKLAGFTIQLTFEPTSQREYETLIKKELQRTFLKRGFLTKRKKRDFEIIFKKNEDGLETKSEGEKQFFLGFEKDFKKSKAYTNHSIGMATFFLLLKEVLEHLLEKDGLILHASSCINRRGELHLFIAPSGGGKSTTANLLAKRGWRKVSDDSIIVRKVKNKWSFFSPPNPEKEFLPFYSKHEGARVFLVKKSKKTYLKDLSEAKALRMLLPQIWTVLGRIKKNTFSNLAKFVEENEVKLLYSNLNEKKIKDLL